MAPKRKPPVQEPQAPSVSEEEEETSSGEEATDAEAESPATSSLPPEKIPEPKTGGAAKTPFSRLWSEPDELRLVNLLIKFRDEGGTKQAKYMSLFLDYIKRSSMFDANVADVSESQLKDKITKLKMKYTKTKVEEMIKLKPHDRQLYDLCYKMWGTALENKSIKSNGGDGDERNRNLKEMATVKHIAGLGGGCDERNPNLKEMAAVTHIAGLEHYVVNYGLNFAGAEKIANMENKWRKLNDESLQLFIKRNELLNEHAKLMLKGKGKYSH